jgi:hypothetical protein
MPNRKQQKRHSGTYRAEPLTDARETRDSAKQWLAIRSEPARVWARAGVGRGWGHRIRASSCGRLVSVSDRQVIFADLLPTHIRYVH